MNSTNSTCNCHHSLTVCESQKRRNARLSSGYLRHSGQRPYILQPDRIAYNGHSLHLALRTHHFGPSVVILEDTQCDLGQNPKQGLWIDLMNQETGSLSGFTV